VFGYVGETYQNATTLNHTIGSMVGAGIEYGVGGSTTLNIFGTGDLGFAGNVGLLELQLSQEHGAGLAVGMGGTNMNVSTIASSIAGLEAYRQNARIADSEIDPEAAVAMRMLYSAGAEGLSEVGELYEQLLTGEATLSEGGTDGKAETTLTEGGKQIQLADFGDGSRRSMVDLGITLSHEAFRDGLDNGVAGQTAETRRAVIGHSAVASMVLGTYGAGMLGGQTLAEAEAFQIAAAGGDFSMLAGYADAAYDSSADYWKVLENGDIVFDGKKDLYDENGELLRRFEGEGGFTASLAEHLGIPEAEADRMMRDAGWTFSEGTFTTDNGTVDTLNNGARALDPGAEFAARYFIQRDYIDRVGSEYGWDMSDALSAAQDTAESEFMDAMRDGTLTPEIDAQYRMTRGLTEFGDAYDAALYGESFGGSFYAPGLLDREAAAAYDPERVANANRSMRLNWSQTDDNPLYSLVTSGAISPLLGPNGESGPLITSTREGGGLAYLTTRAFYPDSDIDLQNRGLAGRPHGQTRAGGKSLAVDIGTGGYPLTTLAYQPVDFLAQDSSIGWGGASGYIQTESSEFGLRYVHLADSYAFRRTRTLNDSAMASGVFRYRVPAGYQFGELYSGSNQYSTGTHLHLEFLPRWFE
jgi:hypothetical protein